MDCSHNSPCHKFDGHIYQGLYLVDNLFLAATVFSRCDSRQAVAADSLATTPVAVPQLAWRGLQTAPKSDGDPNQEDLCKYLIRSLQKDPGCDMHRARGCSANIPGVARAVGGGCVAAGELYWPLPPCVLREPSSRSSRLRLGLAIPTAPRARCSGSKLLRRCCPRGGRA